MVKVAEFTKKLKGERSIIDIKSREFPKALKEIPEPPNKLFIVGDVSSLEEGLGIIGARKATPYGKSCATHFGELCAKNGVTVISGGALGCDCASMRAAVEAGGKSIGFVASIDDVYPKCNFSLFQKIIDTGGAIVSENTWDACSLPFMFRMRNRLIAGLSKAILIVEAGIPSGTFSTADDALEANRDVLAVPGSITSRNSSGSNRLIYQGATPIIDDETFLDELNRLFGCLKSKPISKSIAEEKLTEVDKRILEAVNASNLTVDEMISLAEGVSMGDNAMSWMMLWIAKAKSAGWIAQYPDGTYGPKV